MGENRVWTAEELLAMTPNERHQVVENGISRNIEDVPEHLLELAKDDIQAHIAASEATIA